MEEYRTAETMRYNKKKLMTVVQFMEEYCIGHNKAYQLIHSEGFPAVFCGRKALIIRERVDEWFFNHIGEKF
ncbi:helix-turn-helix domain-containing protein [Clostridium tyrobutyricum]|uniref:helix-turn-helix domain-containing protein n=1 Tax=Clostridium tyrobutyricum TaxID=1519 RepID=UPI0010C4F38C|nr:helix-turn-helix domain-containing protein [Clostridium tyrobutyricum]QCH29475.1 hypothetical protein EZN00_03108 [Clostridium tyrobutyricum]